jgi:lipoprotein signal peptidase
MHDPETSTAFQTGIFNGADVAILIGIALLLFGSWRQSWNARTAKAN